MLMLKERGSLGVGFFGCFVKLNTYSLSGMTFIE